MPEDDEETLSAYLLDGQGGFQRMDPDMVDGWTPSDGLLWIHLNRSAESSSSWLSEHAGLGPLVIEAMLREEPRPRAMILPAGVLAVLRGVNLEPGECPEDMVSLRLWVEEHRVIDLRHRKLRSVSEVRDKLQRGIGPTCSASLLLDLADTMVRRMDPVVDHLEDEVETLESCMLEAPSSELRIKLASIRRRTIRLRRYIAPQREALNSLRVERIPWMDDHHRARLAEIVEGITHLLEDLDCVREHAGVAQDELFSLQSESANRNTYRVSVIAAILLPPSLLAGLLGANLGGIPGKDSAMAFPLLCLGILLLTGLELLLLRRSKWF